MCVIKVVGNSNVANNIIYLQYLIHLAFTFIINLDLSAAEQENPKINELCLSIVHLCLSLANAVFTH